MKNLSELLDEYKVDRDDKKEIAERYRQGVEDVLRARFRKEGDDVSILYGGSLKKGTANSVDCDLDLLCYVDSESDLTVEQIYNIAANELRDKGYNATPKNSAIKVTGKIGDEAWDMTIDVVPGKYFTTGTDDVWLWQHKDSSRLKTNPTKQIGKVQNSKSRDVIRLIKLYRYFKGFPFKSFFLENFCIDVVEPEFKEADDLQDKLIKFCRHYDEIGITKIYDPANSNNDTMQIHSEEEFGKIRENIHELLETLLTDDSETYLNCLQGKPYDIEAGYRRNAFSHAKFIPGIHTYPLFLKQENGTSIINENETISKCVFLRFNCLVINQSNASVKWIISNGGYEARKANQLRGEEVDSSIQQHAESYKTIFIRREHTLYYGNHYVQAVIRFPDGHKESSSIKKVKVR